MGVLGCSATGSRSSGEKGCFIQGDIPAGPAGMSDLVSLRESFTFWALPPPAPSSVTHLLLSCRFWEKFLFKGYEGFNFGGELMS